VCIREVITDINESIGRGGRKKTGKFFKSKTAIYALIGV
jgi:hypothetical protein